MKLAISNIAWLENEDDKVYELMKKYRFRGLEIAPTRFFPENPYDRNMKEINDVKIDINKRGIKIVALQSILFGKNELKIFQSEENRLELTDYIKASIRFAKNIGAKVIVFGSPKNRIMNNSREDYIIAIKFFKELGEYAKKNNVSLCIEANPKEYNTNFINTTEEAFNLVKEVNSEGFGLHVDIGTMLINNENVEYLQTYLPYIKHIHLSEPYLNLINKLNYDKHTKIAEILNKGGYKNWISIEMKKISDISNIVDIETVLTYVRDVFMGGSYE